MKDKKVNRQVQIVLRVLEQVTQEKMFALKGGTAINLFLRDMPRLSVDIDLTYLPLQPRDLSLRHMSEGLKRIAREVEKNIPETKIQMNRMESQKRIEKFVVLHKDTTIKVEANQVLRGSVFPPINLDLSKKAEERFEFFVSIQSLSLADLYGGKICAALDRQHPRDLFDIKILLENEGLTDLIRKAFVVYLASHGRPIHELLNPTRKDVQNLFEKELLNLTVDQVKYAELEKAREKLISKINKDLTEKERLFLLYLKQGTPQWNLLDLPGLEKLPGLQWKLKNIQKMSKSKHAKYIDLLKSKLNL